MQAHPVVPAGTPCNPGFTADGSVGPATQICKSNTKPTCPGGITLNPSTDQCLVFASTPECTHQLHIVRQVEASV